MSLLVLMYHRARAGQFGNSREMLEAHFAHLSGTYHHVLPGEPLIAGAVNVCLSFDDGYFDFYDVAFPLLKKNRLRALLAIPPGVVRERVDVSRADRLVVETADAFNDPGNGAFCTWAELAEMTASGHVTIAAHGYTHRRLDDPEANLTVEIDEPRAMLAARLGQPVDSFVFPYGRYAPNALQRAKKNYRHVFRIGGAFNRDWQQPLLYRVNADSMASPTSLFFADRLASYRVHYFWNRLRRR